jgi:hypothetical protein
VNGDGGGAAAATNGHCSCSSGAERGSCHEPSWVADALQHSSVEAWFHSLIRRHFKGTLKVGSCGAMQVWCLHVVLSLVHSS